MTAHVPRKRFGQHFRVDDGVIGGIVDAIAPHRGEALVEIGPGLGALTDALLAAGARLTVIELDRDLAARWRRDGRVEVVEADVLTVDFGVLPQPLRVVGNLPYNISTPILFHLLRWADRVSDQHFMLQKEVVERMAAGPGSKVYGRLSVMLQAYCNVTPLFVVPPGAFRPAPKVDSAVVRLVPKPAESILVADRRVFANVVRAAFGQRRKTLRNALNGVADVAAIEAAGLRADARAEQVEVAGFVRLANLLAQG